MDAAIRIGAACVMTAASAWGGKMLAGTQARRAQTLRETVSGVRRLKVEMLERRMPVKEALLVCGSIFSAVGQEMKEGSGPGQAGERALEKLCARGKMLDCLEPDDRTALMRLFSGLGEGGGQAQRLLLEDAQEEMERLVQKAVRRQEEQGKLYTSLGALGGLALAILLL